MKNQLSIRIYLISIFFYMSLQKSVYLEYLNSCVHPILEKMIFDLALSQTPQPVDFMINWLFRLKQSQINASSTLMEMQSLNSKKSEQQSVTCATEKIEGNKSNNYYKFDIQAAQTKFLEKSHVNSFKSIEQINRIQKQLKKCSIFNHLDQMEFNIIIHAIEEKKYNEGDLIVEQFQLSSELFIVEEGQLDCYKIDDKNSTSIFLKTYKAGESFGQLSLIYNTPRQATIKSRTKSILWCLGKQTFINIVKDQAIDKRKKFHFFLDQVQIFRNLDPYQKSRIPDYFREIKISSCKQVFKKQQWTKLIYMIESGEVKALKKKQKKLNSYIKLQRGDYFGSIEIIQNILQNNSFFTITNCTFLVLQKEIFFNIIGHKNILLLKKAKDLHQRFPINN